jgi:hypothetical protein
MSHDHRDRDTAGVERKPPLLIALVILVGTLVFAAGAGAAAPIVTSGAFTVPEHSLSGLCPFEVTSGATVNYTERDYFDENGVLTRVAYQIREQDSFAANGKSLRSEWLAFNFEFVFDSSGNIAAAFIDGIVERVPLPDGRLFISAGRIDYAADGFPEFVIAPDHGGIHNLDGFCSALAP